MNTLGEQSEMVFLDAEFCELRYGMQMLSIGMVGSSGEFYAELDAPSVTRTMRGAGKQRFVREVVLAYFGRLTGTQHSLDEIAQKAARWLRACENELIEVAYDYSVDFTLLERLLEISDSPLLAQVVPVHVGYLLEDPTGEAAALASWRRTAEARGLQRHHALADALALKARFGAVHGA